MANDERIQWNLGSDHVLTLTLKDQDGAVVPGATIDITISTRDGQELDSGTMVDNGDGKYSLDLSHSIIEDRKYYVIEVVAKSGGVQGTWRDTFPADYNDLW